MDARHDPDDRHASIELPATPRTPERARTFVADTLHGTPYDTIGDDVALVVSELITNAVMHTRAAVVLTLQAGDGRVRVEVHDQLGGAFARLGGARAEGGRGLDIVATLASAWGVETVVDDGKMVWAELPGASDAG